MERSVLLIEDEEPTRRAFAAGLERRNWSVTVACNGAEALSELHRGKSFDVMVLDLRLPDMKGFDLLTLASNEGISLPPTFVVSAYLDQELDRCSELGIRAFLAKPVEPEFIPELLAAFCDGGEHALTNLPDVSRIDGLQFCVLDGRGIRSYFYSTRRDAFRGSLAGSSVSSSLNDRVKRREEALIELFRQRASQPTPQQTDEPLLIIGRRWNSWYPSFFNADGGAYAVMGASSSSRTPACLVDPGFGSLRILGALGVPVGCLSRCIITHNHPDHNSGVFEYMTARHVLGESTHVYCSASVLEMLRSLAGDKVSIADFSETIDIVQPYDSVSGRRRITATPLKTAHQSMGQIGGSRGVTLASEIQRPVQNVWHTRASCLLMGDTEYHSNDRHPNAEVFQGMRRTLARQDLKVGVLHVGSSQLKAQTGKHLYLPGLKEILKDVDTERKRCCHDADSNKLLVLVSEWGLEHATTDQIQGAIPDVPQTLLDQFSSQSLVLETIELMKEMCNLETINLMPADLGLVVGIESGEIYLNGKPHDPAVVAVRADRQGLTYYLQGEARMARS